MALSTWAQWGEKLETQKLINLPADKEEFIALILMTQ